MAETVFAFRHFETPLVAVAPVTAATVVPVTGVIEAGGNGADEGCWSSAANRNTTITSLTEMKTVINTLVTLENENKAKLNALMAGLSRWAG